jgi:hypothetical protein
MRFERTIAPDKDLWHEKYGECQMCGAWYTYYELHFDAASVAATVGETITGAGGCTGVVVTATLESGSYAGGDAAGHLELSGVTGASDDLAFVDNEALTGSSTFVGTANHQAYAKVYGMRIPIGELVERDGKFYCVPHYRFRFEKQDRDNERLDAEEITD